MSVRTSHPRSSAFPARSSSSPNKTLAAHPSLLRIQGASGPRMPSRYVISYTTTTSPKPLRPLGPTTYTRRNRPINADIERPAPARAPPRAWSSATTCGDGGDGLGDSSGLGDPVRYREPDVCRSKFPARARPARRNLDSLVRPISLTSGNGTASPSSPRQLPGAPGRRGIEILPCVLKSRRCASSSSATDIERITKIYPPANRQGDRAASRTGREPIRPRNFVTDRATWPARRAIPRRADVAAQRAALRRQAAGGPIGLEVPPRYFDLRCCSKIGHLPRAVEKLLAASLFRPRGLGGPAGGADRFPFPRELPCAGVGRVAKRDRASLTRCNAGEPVRARKLWSSTAPFRPSRAAPPTTPPQVRRDTETPRPRVFLVLVARRGSPRKTAARRRPPWSESWCGPTRPSSTRGRDPGPSRARWTNLPPARPSDRGPPQPAERVSSFTP